MSNTVPSEPVSDDGLRIMRDAVYPAQTVKQIQDDASWEHCKAAWRRDEAWLREQFDKLKP